MGLFDPEFIRRVREQIEANPILKREVEINRKVRRCFATHKDWWQDRDVHGPLDEYCVECGVNKIYYSPINRNHESLMTCEEIKKNKKY